MTRLLFAAALALLPFSAGAAEVYKCVTENGVVRYSNTPCKDGQAKKLPIESRPTDIGEVRARTQERQEQLDDLNEAAAAKEEKLAQQAKEQQARDAACKQARERAAKMQTERLMYTGEGENRQYLSSEEIVKRKQDAQDQVNELCGN